MGVASYQLNKKNAIGEARDKGQLIFNYMLAGRDYFREEQRSLVLELVEKERFYPELMFGFVVTRGTWEKFGEKMPQYKFKQATIDPLWPANKADGDELRLIDFFQQNSEVEEREGFVKKNGMDYYYFARPQKVSSEKCLRCHGDPLDAPKDQSMIYGSENGYNWQLGETVSAYIVYIPIKDALLAATKSSLIIVAIGAGCFFLALFVLWLFMNRRVVAPIMMLSRRAEEISLGENLATALKVENKNEIGILTESIDRLRISMLTLLERCRRE